MVQAKLLHSRSHPLNTLPGFIKREDELSFGVSGNKLRKILALIDHIHHKKIPHVYAYGSAHSNFLVGLAQHFNEHQIPYTFICKRPHKLAKIGNFAYLNLLTDRIVFEEPHTFEEGALILPEGGFHPACYEGAKTLAKSIEQNEQELATQFDRIFIDSGSGLSAMGLIAANRKWEIHIVAMKDDEATFRKKGLALGCEGDFTYHTLTNARSFGATNATSLRQIPLFAKKEGILLDPIYTSKMLYELSGPLRPLLTSRSLIIHSGGALGLSGFYDTAAPVALAAAPVKSGV